MLNWGLGHASRSIPIINYLINNSFEPILCSDGISLDLLKKEYPDLEHITLPTYGVEYKHESISANIILALPKILNAIKDEHRQIKILQEKYQAKFIISDNRYGCYFNEIPSFMICHQLSLQTKQKWQGSFASGILNKYLERFDRIFVPDQAGKSSIAGKLIENRQVKNKIFIGPISRMKSLDLPKKFDLSIVLSGPEPQRTILEKALVQQIQFFNGKVSFVRGTNTKRPIYFENLSCEVHDLLTFDSLNQLLCESDLVISRSGYSSLMDYFFTKTKAVLIPTPGQTEQEYLASYLTEKEIFYSTSQKGFSLEEAVKQAKNYTGFMEDADLALMESKLNQVLPT